MFRCLDCEGPKQHCFMEMNEQEMFYDKKKKTCILEVFTIIWSIFKGMFQDLLPQKIILTPNSYYSQTQCLQ